MSENFTQEEIRKWTEVIFNPDEEFIQDLAHNHGKYKNLFINKIAEYLYADMRRARVLITAPFTFNKVFSRLPKEEKKIWYTYAESIPEKLRSLKLFIMPVE